MPGRMSRPASRDPATAMVPAASTRPLTMAALAARTAGRRGIAVRVVRIMPVPYSLLIVSTPRMAEAATIQFCVNSNRRRRSRISANAPAGSTLTNPVKNASVALSKEYRAEHEAIETEFKADKSKCKALTGNTKDVCIKEAKFDYGSHTIFIGRVTSVGIHGEVDPLIYVDGKYTCLPPDAVAVSALQSEIEMLRQLAV